MDDYEPYDPPTLDVLGTLAQMTAGSGTALPDVVGGGNQNISQIAP
ncbi:MAG: hypothetical protein LC789_06205 [Actinobacteria bacterium]|nr:hypothetical protein [Actinomycetota bacterium]